MRIIKNHSEIDATAWKKLVDSSPVATWFQTLEAYDFFASLPSMMTPFVFAVESNEKLKGIVVGYITCEKNPIKQFFTRRAIIYGGPLLSEDISDEELKSLLFALCSFLKSKAIYVETRNFNDYSKWRSVFEQCGFTYQPHLNFHVDTRSLDVIKDNLDNNRRRNIRQSIKEQATIVLQPTIEQVKDYYEILSRLYSEKVRTPLFAWNFFEKLYRMPSAHFLLIQYNNEIIGGTVCVELPNRTLYEWFVCGEDGKYKNIFPSEMATYAGLQYAADNNCICFDMMGAGKPDEHYGVRDFKARFGGQQVEYGRFLKINNKLLYNFGKAGVEAMKVNSFIYMVIC